MAGVCKDPSTVWVRVLHRVLRLAGRQVVIMLTPVRRIFHCEEQNGWEWLYAILTGAGSLLVALVTKLVTRCALALQAGDCLACSTFNNVAWRIMRIPYRYKCKSRRFG